MINEKIRRVLGPLDDLYKNFRYRHEKNLPVITREIIDNCQGIVRSWYQENEYDFSERHHDVRILLCNLDKNSFLGFFLPAEKKETEHRLQHFYIKDPNNGMQNMVVDKFDIPYTIALEDHCLIEEYIKFEDSNARNHPVYNSLRENSKLGFQGDFSMVMKFSSLEAAKLMSQDNFVKIEEPGSLQSFTTAFMSCMQGFTDAISTFYDPKLVQTEKGEQEIKQGVYGYYKNVYQELWDGNTKYIYDDVELLKEYCNLEQNRNLESKGSIISTEKDDRVEQSPFLSTVDNIEEKCFQKDADGQIEKQVDVENRQIEEVGIELEQ